MYKRQDPTAKITQKTLKLVRKGKPDHDLVTLPAKDVLLPEFSLTGANKPKFINRNVWNSPISPGVTIDDLKGDEVYIKISNPGRGFWAVIDESKVLEANPDSKPLYQKCWAPFGCFSTFEITSASGDLLFTLESVTQTDPTLVEGEVIFKLKRFQKPITQI